MLVRCLVLILGGTLLFSACFDPQEGCLDPSAVNYYAAADKDCCCRYPSLILSVDQSYDTLIYRQDSLFPGLDGHLFRIKHIVFYLSDFTLFNSSGDFAIGDSLELKSWDLSKQDTLDRIFTDDFTLIRRSPVDNAVGAFRQDGDFDKISFRIGLNESANLIIPALAPVSHPLYPQKEVLHDDHGFVSFQAVIVRDSSAATPADTLNFYREDLPDLFVEGLGTFNHEIGYDFKLKLKADWAALFEGVNWTVADKSAWKNRIVANLPSVFTVSQ